MGDSSTPNVTVIGKVTMSTVGSASISNIRLQTNSDFAVVVSGSVSTKLYIENCFINCSNNTGISFTSSVSTSFIHMFNCQIDTGTTGISLFASSSTGTLFLDYCTSTNSGLTTTACTASAGNISARISFLTLSDNNYRNYYFIEF